jgi:hypothetical protein
MRRSLLTAALVAVAVATAGGIVPSNVPEAAAFDNKPCGKAFEIGGFDVQTCPLWRGNVPVIDLETGKEVGKLDEGGSANWFVCQHETDRVHRFGGHAHDWWARTMADNGVMGWVSLVYFQGGDDFEKDRGLKVCTPSDIDDDA